MIDWQTKKLGDISTLITSGSRGWAAYYADSGAKFIRMTNLSRDDIQLSQKDMKYVKVPQDNSEGARTKLKDGDILISITAELGKIGFVTANMGDAYINQHVALVRVDEGEALPKVIAYSLSTYDARNKFNRRNDSGAKAGLNLTTIQKFPISLPEKPEQKRIVGILETWDEYIEKLERKIALKVQLKIALMQQIFSRRLRLQGFVKNWQEVRLEEVATIERGKSLTSRQIIPGDHPVIAGGKTSPYGHAKYTHEDVITVSASGANAGYVAYQARKIWASDCSVIYGRTSDYLTLYIYYWLHYMQDRIYGLQTGGAQPHVQPPDLRRFKIAIPEKDEQLSIIALLGSADVEINVLEKLKKEITIQKKYLLKNLITGTIRTPENLKPHEVQS